MKKALTVLLSFGLGAVFCRVFDGVPLTAAVGQCHGGGVVPCSSKNGDVNADGRVDISDAVTVLGNLFLGNPTQLVPLCETQGSSGLPDTGQRSCYDTTHQPVDCGSAFCTGQDGFYARGCPLEGRFIDNSDGTVTDTCTGLMWQRLTADTNGDGLSTVEDSVPWCAALRHCEDLSFAGHDDRRLPNARELQSIVDYGRSDPAIDPVFVAFPAGSYWSSTTLAANPVGAWFVSFGDNFGAAGKAASGFVRAVRNAP